MIDIVCKTCKKTVGKICVSSRMFHMLKYQYVEKCDSCKRKSS